ncbi:MULTISPECIES: transglutaminase-like domain-containing protein [Microbulbifer]|uniref:Transglutaminase-like domain-containing protein n=1 Tax=Microbulbifer celer TaxID=435905 RepID=A0ABW3U8T9_9GAMM|nr:MULTISPECIES: transglutaminase-like domain-containing protein [Microbulbifer]UFN56695.1 transglutaminase-like domain-containing protein [Microbulbifer celer]
MRLLLGLLLFSLLLISLPEILQQSQPPEEVLLIQRQMRTAESSEDAGREDNQSGTVVISGTSSPLTESMVQRAVGAQPEERSSYISIWDWQGVKTATASARGLDSLHHFANSYLVGFQPFETDALWVPLYTLATRKEYQYDHLQYSGLADIWQTSRQAYYQKRGDCEDHAILLADWLINLGVDARVALGTYKGEGHAWVIAVVNDTEYLLEATSKRRQSSWQAMPLAALAEGYEVEFQFNRDFFWAKTTSAPTRTYRGKHWVRKSQFIRG